MARCRLSLAVLLVGASVASACERSEPRATPPTANPPTAEPAVDNDLREAAENRARARACNHAIPDAELARNVALRAARAAGFSEEVEPSTLIRSKGYVLSPLFPVGWPPAPCVARYYVHLRTSFSDSTSFVDYGGAEAAIDVDLRTGKAKLARITDGPGSETHTDERNFEGGDGPVFRAIAGEEAPNRARFVTLRKWIQGTDVAATMWVWHRSFLQWLTADDPAIARRARTNGESWLQTHHDVEHPSPTEAPGG